jgi:hypothetical protein
MVESYRALARLLSAALGQDQAPNSTAEPANQTTRKGHLSDAAKDTGSDPIGVPAAT